MIRRSIISKEPLLLMPGDKRKCLCVADYIVIQCIIMFAVSSTVLQCFWKPDKISFDYYKLASIMYLYDNKACGYSIAAMSMKSLNLSNDTRGLNVLPIESMPPIVTVSTKLSAKTRTYIKLSLCIHCFWIVLAIAFRIIAKKNNNGKLLHLLIIGFLYFFFGVIFFDLSMAIVYISHIRQTLTKGMVARHCGWSALLKFEQSDDFAGWLPLLASACWMRGIFIFGLNIYSCRIIYFIKNKIQEKAYMQRLIRVGNLPIPEPKLDQPLTENVLYYKPGTPKPYVKFSGSNEY